MLPQRLHVAHLEPGAFQQHDGAADRRQFAVGEDVGVDERVDPVAALVGERRPGDLVVEQAPSRAQQAVQPLGVLAVAGGADVLGHADGGDGVERAVRGLAVVLDADLDQVPQPLPRHPFPGVGGLLLGERDADGPHAVVAGGVQHQGAPAAADVEEPLPLAQAELAADQIEFGGLRRLQGLGVVVPERAGVDHGGAEDQLVERVAHVVVVADGPAVAPQRVQRSRAAADLLARRGRRHGRGRSGQPQQFAGGGEFLPGRQVALGPDRFEQQAERGVEIAFDVEFPGHPGPGQADFAGLEQQPAQRPAVPHHDDRGAGRAGFRAVPRAEAEGKRRTEKLLGERGEPGGDSHADTPPGMRTNRPRHLGIQPRGNTAIPRSIPRVFPPAGVSNGKKVSNKAR